MNSSDGRKREVEALRERISSLSGAVLRISASLDVGTVLRETVDSARALTGARYGVITTIDKAGRPQDFVTSGLTADEQRQLEAWPHAMRFFEHLRDLPGPLRLPDLPAYLRSLGYADVLTLSRTLQATPMRHRGVHVGDFFLGEKEGGREFTADDEEVLVLFASQAATAIANARAHRDERRARADLEALVETSPVGVVVFDGGTGRPASLNREARRLVDGLNAPGRPPEELLGALTCRFSDGREIALAELPMKQVISDAATVRAEEVVLSVPDGRSVTLLVNATPIHAADGAAESMVVTLQDLASLRELERLQAEFLSMVSHELRAPLTSIKGSAATVLRASRVLDPAEVRQFFRIIDAQADHMDGLIGDLLDAGRIDSGTLTVDPEPAEVAALVDRARTTFVSGGGRQAVCIDLPPEEPAAMPGSSRDPSPRSRDDRDATRIVVVDDDPEMLRHARDALTEAGYTPVVTGDPGELAGLVRTHRPGLVLLDLLLPGTGGIELMERVPGLADLPVIFISAYGRDETIARALEAGAADYLVKPFSPAELTAVLGELTIDHEQRRATVAGRPLEPTATEYGLLRALALRAGKVATYESLLRQVWGERGDAKDVTHLREEAPPQARRRRGQTRLDPHRARSRLPPGRTGRRLRPRLVHASAGAAPPRRGEAEGRVTELVSNFGAHVGRSARFLGAAPRGLGHRPERFALCGVNLHRGRRRRGRAVGLAMVDDQRFFGCGEPGVFVGSRPGGGLYSARAHRAGPSDDDQRWT